MILIENDIVFLSVPKNASNSVHFALEESDFHIEPTFEHDRLVKTQIKINPFLFKDTNHKIKVHPHITTLGVYSYLKRKPPTIFIKRDFSERFVSAINFILHERVTFAYPQIYDILHHIDNDWIYNTINDDVIKSIINFDRELYNSLNIQIQVTKSIENVDRYITNALKTFTKKKSLKKNKLIKDVFINFKMLDSQEIYKSGYTPKYIFDISELDKLENFLYERYGKKLEIKKINELDKNKIRTNIVNDTKLRNWVWNKFEKHHFQKKIF